jgi:ActR/RegA family two-component response regulator
VKERILVLEDDERWLRSIEAILNSEYNLFLTKSNREAIKEVKRTPFALVILDWKLEDGTTALEVLEQMRKSVPDLRAIILTAYDKSDLAVASLQAGALDYITKGPRKGAAGNLSERLIAAIQKHKKGNKLIKVFLSYERSDLKRISRLRSKLVAQGFLPWFDIHDTEGGRWEPQIKKAIHDADFFLACLSPNSVDKNGFIRKEIKWALEKQDELAHDEAYIIPIRLVPDVERPEQLKQFQSVELFKDGGFTKLVRMLLAKKSSKK